VLAASTRPPKYPPQTRKEKDYLRLYIFSPPLKPIIGLAVIYV